MPAAASRLRRRRRRRVRAILRWTSTTATLCGLVLLLFVARQEWWTGVQTARAQAALRAEVEQRLVGETATSRITGDALGILQIPRIALDVVFVEGIDLDSLAKGPGHYPGTPMPGHGGNVAIAGHRTTHMAPFWALDSLRRGDEILVRTREGRFVYRVVWRGIGDPDDTWVIAPTAQPSLTLTTCNPRFSARERLVVRAVQVYGPTPEGFIDHRNEPLESWMIPPARRLSSQAV